MNLADVIRQAATLTGSEVASEVAVATPIPAAAQPAPQLGLSVATDAKTTTPKTVKPSGSQQSTVTAPPTEAAATVGNMVRLELYLSPEQLSLLLGAVVKTQHSVLTLKEAATYLRLPTATVIQLAREKQLPGLLVDGKWRFSHAALEEWLDFQGGTEIDSDRGA